MSGLRAAGVADADAAGRRATASRCRTWVRSTSGGELPRAAAADSAGARVEGLKTSLSPPPPTACPPARRTAVGTLDVRADQASPRRAATHAHPDADAPRATPTHTHTHPATPTPRPTAAADSSATRRPTTTVPRDELQRHAHAGTPAPGDPRAVSGRHLAVVGTYSYTDTFGAYRADMPEPPPGRRHLRDVRLAGRRRTGRHHHPRRPHAHRPQQHPSDHVVAATTSTTRICRASPPGSRRASEWSPGKRSATWATPARKRGRPPHLHFEIHPRRRLRRRPHGT